MNLARLLTAFTLLFSCNCSLLYTDSPRYNRKRQLKPAKPIKQPKHIIEQNKGNLPWPAKGTVITKFGFQTDPKYGTKTKNLGIDISCSPGTPVIAISDGIVSYADVFIGQGLMIIIEHGGGFHSVYTRLSELKKRTGEKVKTGDTIALTGEILHFEIRIDGKAVDPLPWLKKQ